MIGTICGLTFASVFPGVPTATVVLPAFGKPLAFQTLKPVPFWSNVVVTSMVGAAPV